MFRKKGIRSSYSYERNPQAIDSARLRLGLLSSFVVALPRAMIYSYENSRLSP